MAKSSSDGVPLSSQLSGPSSESSMAEVLPSWTERHTLGAVSFVNCHRVATFFVIQMLDDGRIVWMHLIQHQNVSPIHKKAS